MSSKEIFEFLIFLRDIIIIYISSEALSLTFYFPLTVFAPYMKNRLLDELLSEFCV